MTFSAIRKPLLHALVIGLAYFGAGCLGLCLATVAGAVPPFRPGAGVGLVAALLLGWRAGPGIALGVVLLSWWMDVPRPMGQWFIGGALLEAIVPAMLVRRFFNFQPGLERIQDVLILAGASVVGASLSAGLAVVGMLTAGQALPGIIQRALSAWLLATLLGDFVVGGLLLAWRRWPKGACGLVPITEGWAVVSLTILTCLATFFQKTTSDLFLPYWVFPTLIWGAIRFGPRGAAFLSLTICGLASWATFLGRGPFHEENFLEKTLALQAFLGLVAGTGLFLAAMMRDRQVAEETRRRIEAESRRAEQENLRLLEWLRIHVERMPVAYLMSNAEFRFTRWNPAAERLFGWQEADILGKHPFEIIVPPEEQPLVRAMFDRLARGDMNAHGGSASRTRDGRTIICEWTNTPLFDDRGRFTGLVSMAQDVTQRARIQASLQASEERYRTIVETAHEGVVVVDAEGRTTFVNRRMADVLGVQAETMVGRSFFAWVAREDQEAAQACLALEPGRHELVEFRLEGKDANVVWVLVSATPLEDTQGTCTGSLLMVTDVTERRLLESQFRQAQKMDGIGRLAGGIAHDFNNLLTVISGYGEVVLNALPKGDACRPMVEEIRKASDRAADLTRQLLTFSRRTILEPRVLDLNLLLRESEKMIRRLVGEDIVLMTSFADNPWPVKGDPGLLLQVILNLIVNARDAMPQGGHLTIETANVDLDEHDARTQPGARTGPHVLLAVSDTGCGIPREIQNRVFEPFFTTKEPGKGTGLGLATVYGIVKQSGGHVAVLSEPGVGTAFKIYLPRSGSPSELLAPGMTGKAPAYDGQHAILQS